MTDDHSQHDNQSKQRIVEDIEKYSCHIALLEPDNYLPGFAYTIGLYEKFGHPEIICFGLPTNVMGSVLNTARDIVKQGGKITTTKQYPDFLNNYNVEFINVDKEFYANYFGYAGWYYNMTFNFPVLQLVWPDKQNKFPWDKDFNPDWNSNNHYSTVTQTSNSTKKGMLLFLQQNKHLKGNLSYSYTITKTEIGNFKLVNYRTFKIQW